jgi:hypothetical protein
MSRITGKVRRNDEYLDVRLIVDGLVLDLGLLDKDERREVAEGLRALADDIEPCEEEDLP